MLPSDYNGNDQVTRGIFHRSLISWSFSRRSGHIGSHTPGHKASSWIDTQLKQSVNCGRREGSASFAAFGALDRSLHRLTNEA